MSLDAFVWEPRESRLRFLLAAAAATSAVAHAIVVPPHVGEAPYMGLEFVVLTVACLLLAAAALVRDSAAVYVLAIVTCGLAVVGYGSRGWSRCRRSATTSATGSSRSGS